MSLLIKAALITDVRLESHDMRFWPIRQLSSTISLKLLLVLPTYLLLV